MHLPAESALAEELFRAGLDAVDPDRAVRRNLEVVRRALDGGEIAGAGGADPGSRPRPRSRWRGPPTTSSAPPSGGA